MMKYESNEDYIEDLRALGQLFSEDLLQHAENQSLEPRSQKLMEFSFQMEKKSEASVKAGIFLPMEYLFSVFQLAPFERYAVKLAMLPELSRSFERLFASFHGQSQMTLLSPDLAVYFFSRLTGGEELKNIRCFSSKTVLTSYFMDKRTGPIGSGLSQQFALRERIKNFVLAEELTDPELAGKALLCYPEGAPGGGAEEKLLSMERFLGKEEPVLFFLKGPKGSGKEALAKDFCQRQAVPLLLCSLEKWNLKDSDYNERILTECMIQGCSLALSGFSKQKEPLEDEAERNRLLSEFLEEALSRMPYLFLLSEEEEWDQKISGLAYRFVPVLFDLPNGKERLSLWEEGCQACAYPIDPGVSLSRLANKFTFTAGQIRAAVFEAESRARWQNSDKIDEECLYAGCYSQLPAYSGNNRVTKVIPVYGFSDLVLPSHSKEILRTACQQVDYSYRVYEQWGFGKKLPYGRGLSMVFSGPPGTGKTMGAQVVAGLLKLELFKVDLAGVVSKYIGETEKNLQQIFNDAKKSQAILFFDEADVLFSKRTEIKDSNDKYSNMEAAFMLQKIEEYEGVSILATNYMQNFDEAFKRRIKFIIDFPFPNAHYRELLWQKVFPKEVPMEEDVDFVYLANSFELSGSNVKNIAINATFMAAAEETRVGMMQILTALRNEMAKSGKSVPKEDLGQYSVLF